MPGGGKRAVELASAKGLARRPTHKSPPRVGANRIETCEAFSSAGDQKTPKRAVGAEGLLEVMMPLLLKVSKMAQRDSRYAPGALLVVD